MVFLLVPSKFFVPVETRLGGRKAREGVRDRGRDHGTRQAAEL